MKRFAPVLLCLLLAVPFAGCSKEDKREATQYYTAQTTDGMKSTCYILEKSPEGNFKSVFEPSGYSCIFGLHQNKLYFSDSKGLAYIDTSASVPERISWIDYPAGHEYLDPYINAGVASGDKLYFSYFLGWDSGKGPNDGLLSLNLSDKSFAETVQIDSMVTSWNYNEKDDSILCLSLTGRTSDGVQNKSLYSLNCSTQAKTPVLNDINRFRYYENGSIMYCRDDDKNEVRMYNLETKSDESLFTYSISDSLRAGSFCSAEIFDDEVYYLKDNSIIMLNGGKNDVFYAFPESSAPPVGQFYHVNKDIILVDPMTNPRYLAGGELLTSLPDSLMSAFSSTSGNVVKVNPAEINGWHWRWDCA